MTRRSVRDLLFVPFLSLVLILGVCCPASAETLNLDGVWQQAIEHSFALKISGSDITLKKIEQKEVQSLYLPTLSLRYDTGYAWALDNDGATVTIGDSVSATDLSTWRNSFSVSGSLMLYDAGAREEKSKKARYGLRAAESARQEQELTLRLKVLETYLQGLQLQLRVKNQAQLLDLRKQLYRTLEKLQQAGTVGQAQVQETALILATELTRLDEARFQLHKALGGLSTLTGQDYNVEATELAELPATIFPDASSFDVAQLPQVKVFDEELAQLRAERSAAWRSMYPSIGLYGNYRLYGADTASASRSLEDLSGRDATLAVVVQWEFFSGFRDKLNVAKLDEQIRRVGWQRQQRIVELQQEIESLDHLVEQIPDRSDHQQKWTQAASKVKNSTQRMGKQGLLDKPAALSRQIDMLEKELQRRLAQTKQQADLLRRDILKRGAGS